MSKIILSDKQIPVVKETILENGQWGNIEGDLADQTDLQQALNQKVDIEAGKGLSSNDFTDADKEKLDELENVSLNAGDNVGITGQYPNLTINVDVPEVGIPVAEKAQPNGVATLDNDGKVPSDQLPDVSASVTSVNNKTGAVVLNASDVGAATTANITTEINKAISSKNSTNNAGVVVGALANSVAIGDQAFAGATNSVAIGANASTGSNQAVIVGASASASTNATAIGTFSNATSSSTSVGHGAIANGAQSVSVGRDASNNGTNCTSLGYAAQTTGSHQVQLGNSSTTTYAYGAVQDRSDSRDKADIHNCDLGLDFINALQPKKYKWDYREDYAAELFPPLNREDFETEEAYQTALDQQQLDRCAFFANPVKDGSKTRSRYHYGLIADELKTTLDALNIDFGGYQDHSINGGMCVKSIGYIELIAPLIKAVQELSAELQALKNQTN